MQINCDKVGNISEDLHQNRQRIKKKLNRGLNDGLREVPARVTVRVGLVEKDNERLRTKVEHTEHDRETLVQLENAFEAVGGDLVDEVLSLQGLRSEVESICTLLYEASQDGVGVGPEAGSSWEGIDGARRWADRIKGVMAEVATMTAEAFPDEDPEHLAGAYGDGFDAVLGAMSRLTEERFEARAEAERLRADIEMTAAALRDRRLIGPLAATMLDKILARKSPPANERGCGFSAGRPHPRGR